MGDENVITLDNYICLYSLKSTSLDEKYKKILLNEIAEFNGLYKLDLIQGIHDATDLKITNINGMKLDNMVYYEYKCKYCDSVCHTFTTREISYYCYDCNVYVCAQCKNNCDLHEIRNNYIKGSVYCNECNEILAVLEPRFSSMTDDYDMCLECTICYDTTGLISIYDDINLGSILDWIKIANDENNNFILCNLNPSSNYYKQLAFLVINNANEYFLFTTKKTRLHQLLLEYMTYTHNHNLFSKLSKDDRTYSEMLKFENVPILKMVSDIANLKYHGFYDE